MTHEDKRVRRTKERLRNALLHLILEKSYEQITVQNILDAADVSRSAFYAHFSHKDDLLMAGFPEDILSYGQDTGESPIPSVSGMFAHMQEGHAWFQAMTGSQMMLLISKLTRQRMVENWLDHIAKWAFHEEATAIPATAVAHYLTGALTSLLFWWVNEGMIQTPEEMNHIFQQLAKDGLGQLIQT